MVFWYAEFIEDIVWVDFNCFGGKNHVLWLFYDENRIREVLFRNKLNVYPAC